MLLTECWGFAKKTLFGSIFNSLLTQKTDYWWQKLPQEKAIIIMFIWCLKQFKDFNHTFSISRSFFSEKQFSNLYTKILFSFSLGGCVEEVVNNQQIIKDASLFPEYKTLTIIH